jgi:hypothetical protein
MRKITQARLREVLDYCPKTGLFTWRERCDAARKWNSRFAGKTAGYAQPGRYIQIRFDGGIYYAHRLAFLWMEGWMPRQVDHENLDKADNRWSNLRAADASKNSSNRSLRGDNTSGYKGVCWHRKAGKWTAMIQLNGRSIYLGLHESLEDAAAAYKTAAEHYFGEFARTN